MKPYYVETLSVSAAEKDGHSVICGKIFDWYTTKWETPKNDTVYRIMVENQYVDGTFTVNEAGIKRFCQVLNERHERVKVMTNGKVLI